MQSAAWVKLFRHIPAEEQAKLMLVTANGTEIAVQCFLRIDPECLALRGRVAGSTDAGRVFFVPYSQIDYFGFQQPLKESEFHELFGNLEIQSGAALPATPPAAPPAAAAPRPAAPAVPEPNSPTTCSRNPLSIKSTVLEKFRSRSSNAGAQIRPPLDE
jgi:hypothetical protein